jgi:hypothetical protein
MDEFLRKIVKPDAYANFYGPPAQRPEGWEDDPDLRRAVEWLKTFITPQDWIKRREAAAVRLYKITRGLLESADDKGRFFSETDSFGWYLFLADAYLDHSWNYDPMFGSRVVPVFAAIGRNLSLLKEISGIEKRVRRLAGSEKRQPNGGLFELLVAAAYCKIGGNVTFLEERPGKSKTHDMDVLLHGQKWAVECKRMETGEYGERERARMRELWCPIADYLASLSKSVYCNVNFKVEVCHIPEDYLVTKAQEWLATSHLPLFWNDEVGAGTIKALDLLPLQKELEKYDILASGTRLLELLSGKYVRNGNYIQLLHTKSDISPRYVSSCDIAVLLQWESSAEEAINNRARDILKKLSEATSQLPDATPGIVHIGFEAVDGERVEKGVTRKF